MDSRQLWTCADWECSGSILPASSKRDWTTALPVSPGLEFMSADSCSVPPAQFVMIWEPASGIQPLQCTTAMSSVVCWLFLLRHFYLHRLAEWALNLVNFIRFYPYRMYMRHSADRKNKCCSALHTAEDVQGARCVAAYMHMILALQVQQELASGIKPQRSLTLPVHKIISANYLTALPVLFYFNLSSGCLHLYHLAKPASDRNTWNQQVSNHLQPQP